MNKILLSIMGMLLLLGLTFIDKVNENPYILIPCVFVTFLLGVNTIIQLYYKRKKGKEIQN